MTSTTIAGARRPHLVKWLSLLCAFPALPKFWLTPAAWLTIVTFRRFKKDILAQHCRPTSLSNRSSSTSNQHILEWLTSAANEWNPAGGYPGRLLRSGQPGQARKSNGASPRGFGNSGGAWNVAARQDIYSFPALVAA